MYKTSIDFLTQEKIIFKNITQNSENEDEVFEETRRKIKADNQIKLSGIPDFDELDIYNL
ncbi:hypothetical protein [Salinimicrobium xinjiangense]|uniref:hypothetical protein n=1 Tax=Salinimicrobium xinjiangense TaxID=438596 RepID=UPI00041110A2|nr:hypothetical protein [Salinimicrobium xinjiangense]